jgi:hypothetical protein
MLLILHTNKLSSLTKIILETRKFAAFYIIAMFLVLCQGNGEYSWLNDAECR